jgi:hypothetical protein
VQLIGLLHEADSLTDRGNPADGSWNLKDNNLSKMQTDQK